MIVELFVGADDKNSSANIIQVINQSINGIACIGYLFHEFVCSPFQLDQLVLALPSQDYYLKASSEGDLQAYHKYMVSIAVLLGANASTAEQELQDVVKFEMQLANVRRFSVPVIELFN